MGERDFPCLSRCNAYKSTSVLLLIFHKHFATFELLLFGIPVARSQVDDENLKLNPKII